MITELVLDEASAHLLHLFLNVSTEQPVPLNNKHVGQGKVSSPTYAPLVTVLITSLCLTASSTGFALEPVESTDGLTPSASTTAIAKKTAKKTVRKKRPRRKKAPARRAPRRRFVQLAAGPGYNVLCPAHAWGTPLMVSHLQAVLQAHHQQFPDAPPVYIHDLSRRRGGKLDPHVSHRTGRDVDIRIFLKRRTEHYLEASPRTLDVERTWFLISALVKTNDVQYIFLDYRLQRAVYRLALKEGMTKEQLRDIFQFPRGTRSLYGIVRHESGHKNHIHVRFRKAPTTAPLTVALNTNPVSGATPLP